MRSTKLPSSIERLLGFGSVRVPPHVLSATPEALRYGRFVAETSGFEFEAYKEVPLPEDLFGSGPLGGAVRDLAALEAAARELAQDESFREAALVVPDAWLRVAFAESGALPRARRERDEVLQWKLKKLVPFRIDDLRVRVAPVSPLAQREEPERWMFGFGAENLFAQLEATFDKVGVRIGHLTNTSLALTAALAEVHTESGLGALVVVGEAGYTLVFTHRNEVVLHRYRGLRREDAQVATDAIGRDLLLTRSFLGEQFPAEKLSRLLLLAPSERAERWLGLLTEGLGVPAVELRREQLPLRGLLPDAPWVAVAPMLGAACQEVA